MAYDEGLAQRVREALEERDGVTERKMFGGLAFLLRGNMCCGVVAGDLMVRVGPAQYDQALESWVARGVTYAGSLPAK